PQRAQFLLQDSSDTTAESIRLCIGRPNQTKQHVLHGGLRGTEKLYSVDTRTNRDYPSAAQWRSFQLFDTDQGSNYRAALSGQSDSVRPDIQYCQSCLRAGSAAQPEPHNQWRSKLRPLARNAQD